MIKLTGETMTTSTIRNKFNIALAMLAATALFALVLLSGKAYAAPFITGTGYDYSYPGGWSTNIGAGRDVRLLVNGVDSGLTGTTDINGDYSIDLLGGSIYNAGDILTVYLDDEFPNGVTVTVGDTANAGIAGLDIYRDTLIARSESVTAITNANLDTGNNGDGDITAIYDDAGGTTLTQDDSHFYLWPGTSFAPGGDITTNGEVHMLGTYVAGSETLNLTYGASETGQFDPGLGNIYNNVVHNSSYDVINNNPLTTVNFSNDGDMVLNGSNLTVTGTYVNTGFIYAYGSQTIAVAGSPNGGGWEFRGDTNGVAETFDISSFFTTYGYIDIEHIDEPIASNRDTFILNSPVTIQDLYIGGGTFDTNDQEVYIIEDITTDSGGPAFFDAGGSQITVGGDLDIEDDINAFIPGTSTIIFTENNYHYIGEGSMNFCNIVLQDDTNDATPVEIYIEEGIVLNILTGCTLTATGLDADDTLSILSDSDGIQATFNVVDGVSAVTASDLAITDNVLQYNGVTASPEFNPVNGTDGGNTLGWFSVITDFDVTVEQDIAQADPTTVDSAEFTVVFSEAINPATFDSTDITLTDTTGTVTTGPTTADNITWSFTVTGMSDGDTVVATIPALAAQNAGGDNNIASTSTDNKVTYGIEDGDGVPDSVEDAAAPNGDGNGDGILDSTQSEVTSIPNPITGAHTTLEVSNGCLIISGFEVVAESSLSVADPDYDYPVGLNDFVLTCNSPGDSAQVVFYYDQEYDATDWAFKKYDTNGNEYSDITDTVTFGTADVNGTTVTTATYTVTDGGVGDIDGEANGTIVDPAGPAIGLDALAETGAASTALLPIAGVAFMSTSIALIYLSRNKFRGLYSNR